MPIPLHYRGFRVTRGDATGAQLAILVPTDYRVLHFASAADENTDWNVANPTHPTQYWHSETTPATDWVSISHDGDNAVFNVAGGNFSFTGGDLFFANAQGMVIGYTAQETVSDGGGATDNVPEFQVLGTAQADSTLMVGMWSTTDAAGPMIALVKSGNAAIGSHTTVADNEYLGRIIAFGDDGTDLETPAAEIRAVVDGTPAGSQIGGSWEFYTTPDGSTTLTLVMTLTSGQNVVIASGNGLNVGSATRLTVSDGGGATDLIPEVQALGVGTAFAGGAFAVATFNTTNDRTVSPKLILVKGAAATQVATTAVADNEVIGSIIAYGSDGTDFETPVAAIEFVVDDSGGPGTGAIGGSLEFSTTADGGETLTLAMVISSAQVVAVNPAGTNALGLVVGTTALQTIAGGSALLQAHSGTGAVPEAAMAVGKWGGDATPAMLWLVKSRGAIGTHTIIVTGDVLGSIRAWGSDGVDFNSNGNASAAIEFVSVGTIGADRVPAEIRFLTQTNAAPGVLTERFRIDETGVIQAGVYTNANVTAAGAGIFAGGMAFTDVANAWIDDASQGNGTVAHYIGNNTINVTAPSDARLKEHFLPYEGNMLDAIKALEFQTYEYIPEGLRQEYGRTFGITAQGMQGVLPQYVFERTDGYLQIAYHKMTPVVLRGIQEMSVEMDKLRATVKELQDMLAGK